jgi:hypothetical protein
VDGPEQTHTDREPTRHEVGVATHPVAAGYMHMYMDMDMDMYMCMY